MRRRRSKEAEAEGGVDQAVPAVFDGWCHCTRLRWRAMATVVVTQEGTSPKPKRHGYGLPIRVADTAPSDSELASVSAPKADKFVKDEPAQCHKPNGPAHDAYLQPSSY